MTNSRLTILAGMTWLIFLCSCGGGGGGAGPFDLLDIQVAGVGDPIYGSTGTPSQVACPPEAFVNARVTLRFTAPVDPASLPSNGAAVGGGIEITDIQTQQAAQGVFTLDPADPRTVYFDALSPPVAQQPCVTGFSAQSSYFVTVHGMDGSGSAMIQSGGQAIPSTVQVCFSVTDCPGPSPYFDAVPTAPSVAATSPPMNGSAPLVLQADVAGTMGGSRISIDLDQPVNPATVNANTVVLLNITANPQGPVPQAATVTFVQAGTLPEPLHSRIFLDTQLPLNDGDVYQLILDGVSDWNGDTAMASDLLFTVQDENNPVSQTFQEGFDSTVHRSSTQGIVLWDGSGAVNAVSIDALVGDGSDGVGIFDTSLVINTDQLPTSHPGTFNFTNVTFGDLGNLAVTLQYTGTTDLPPGESNHRVVIRSQGAILIHDGTVIDCSGRDGMAGGTAPAANTSNRLGGWGGPGGGRGGTSSPNTDGTLSPSGDPGEGGRIDASDPMRPGDQPNTDVSNPFFGGGGGGTIAAAPSFLDAAAGGGGGTASSFGGYDALDPAPSPTFTFSGSQPGEPHQGSDGAGTGAPPPGPAGPFPPGMIPPLRDAVGGSGGGAGGDRVTVVSITATHIPGGAGGGGGGALELTCLGPFTFGVGVTLDCQGGDGGGAGSVFVGKGGGGSGGSILVRSLGAITFGLGVQFDAAGGEPSTASPALNGDGGRGGDGVVQIEDGNALAASMLPMLSAFVRGEFTTGFPVGLTDPASSPYGGTAISVPVDTGASHPRYTSASASVDLGTVSGGTVVVELIGIAEDPANPGSPATVAQTAGGLPLMTAPVPLSQVNQLDGYRFFQFVITMSFDPPPLSSPTDTLPSVDSLTVQFEQ